MRSFSIDEPGGRIRIERIPSSCQKNLTVDREPIFMTGNTCGSCGFFFQRVSSSREILSAGEIAARLNIGLSEVDDEIVAAAQPLLPPGTYRATLFETAPRLTQLDAPDDYYSRERTIMWGAPDEFWQGITGGPKTPYYRLRALPFDGNKALYEFMVPFQRFDDLDTDRVAEYASMLRAGARPTALALSLLSVQALSPWWDYDGTPELAPDVVEHWCVTHYLIDGHHKAAAASRTEQPLSLLSLMTDEGNDHWTSYVDRALELMNR